MEPWAEGDFLEPKGNLFLVLAQQIDNKGKSLSSQYKFLSFIREERKKGKETSRKKEGRK
jgi:hypothetical protein